MILTALIDGYGTRGEIRLSSLDRSLRRKTENDQGAVALRINFDASSGASQCGK